MQLGLDILTTDKKNLLKGKRIGILGHQASCNSRGQPILDLLGNGGGDWEVTTLFGPEHGITSGAKYMEPIESATDPSTRLPIYSLYGRTEKSLRPKKYMFKNIDTLVVDLQDVGSRYYTYIWTILLCVEACAQYKKEVLICDRPNPINGETVEGEINETGYTSFVGLYPIPVRHGMTIAEIVLFLNATFEIGCELTIVPMENWERKWFWEETGIPWINPSPNIRSPKQALLYPGMCLLEATNISEGRGTDTPFEMAGAPFIDSKKCLEELKEFELPGIEFEETAFTPMDDKWKGELCRGVRFKITDRGIFKPYATGIALVWTLYGLYRDEGFQWRIEPYEFIEDIPAIDLLTGGTTVRRGIERHLPLSEILEWVGEPSKSFQRQRTPFLLY